MAADKPRPLLQNSLIAMSFKIFSNKFNSKNKLYALKKYLRINKIRIENSFENKIR